MPDKPSLLLVGAGGHCRSCMDVIEQEGRFAIGGIIDRRGAPAQSERDLLGHPVIGTDDHLAALRSRFSHALVTVGQIGSPAIRAGLFEKLRALGFGLPVIVSPRAYVSPHAAVGEGTVVMHGAIVNAAARVGRNCILNSASLVEHDAVIGDHCHVSTGAIVNGGAMLGEGGFLGSHATVVHGIRTGPRMFFKANQLVRSDRDGHQAKD